MKRVLGRKQVSRNIDWLEAMRHIEELISLDEVKAYEATAVERIAKAAEGNARTARASTNCAGKIFGTSMTPSRFTAKRPTRSTMCGISARSAAAFRTK